MRNECRRCAGLIAIFAIIALSTVSATPGDPGSTKTPETNSADQPCTDSAPARPPNKLGGTGVSPVIPSPDDDSDSPAYTIRYAYRPDVVNYYVIENELRDSGGVPGWLSYTTTARDKRTIIQRVLPPKSPSEDAPPPDSLVNISWECDRYEIRERNMKNETTFDSLRHTYPPPSLRELGQIPGSTSTFSIDSQTGRATQLKITPAKVTGPSSKKKLSRTAKRCKLTNKTLGKLLFDLGPFFFPDTPKRVGEHWTKTHREKHETVGMVTTELACTLRSVRQVGDRKIATIDLSGEVFLQSQGRPTATTTAATTTPASTTATSRPGHIQSKKRRPPRKKKETRKKKFTVEKAVCAGSVEFDLTRGELIEMTLHRELNCAAKLAQSQPDSKVPSEIRTGIEHVLRVNVSRTPPSKPVIVGGPKPPPVPPEKVVKTKPKAKRSRATSQRNRSSKRSGRKATTQRAHPRHDRGR